MFGIVGGFVLTFVAVSVYAALSGHPRHPSQYGEDVVSLLALWTGFVAAAVIATRTASRGPGRRPGRAGLAPRGRAQGDRERVA